AVDAAEARQCVLGHEHDDDGSRLRPQLETNRGGYGVVIRERPASYEQGALAILAADADSGLDHRREHQNRGRLRQQLARASDVEVELVQRLPYLVVDLGAGFGLGWQR